MKITIHIELRDTEWVTLLQVADQHGNEDSTEAKFPAPKDDGIPIPFTFTGMMRTIDGLVQSRIWPELLEEASALADSQIAQERSSIIIP